MSSSHIQDFFSTCIALFLMFWLFTSTLTAILIPWYQLSGFKDDKITAICGISILFALSLLSYAAASLTSPGNVPEWYIELYATKEAVEGALMNAEKPRWCQKCCATKPPRAHHCSTCDRCVLKMDHHCPWISNCVGFFNHKQFLQFLAFTLLTILVVLAAIVACLIPSASGSFIDFASIPQLLILVTNMALLIALFVLLSVMFAMSLAQIFKNMTAIEKEELEYAEFRSKEKIIFPYTFPRALRNFQVVFGSNWLFWLLPIPGSFHLKDHDGCTFPTRKGSMMGGFWPLFEHSKVEEKEELLVEKESHFIKE